MLTNKTAHVDSEWRVVFYGTQKKTTKKTDFHLSLEILIFSGGGLLHNNGSYCVRVH